MNNWAVAETEEQVVDVVVHEDVAVIAKEIRGLLKSVPGAVFSVRINRQWARVKEDPKSIIYVSGAIKFWGDDYTPKKQEQSTLKMLGMMKDVAEEYGLELLENRFISSYTFIQQH
jgi:hypothetical protein